MVMHIVNSSFILCQFIVLSETWSQYKEMWIERRKHLFEISLVYVYYKIILLIIHGNYNISYNTIISVIYVLYVYIIIN